MQRTKFLTLSSAVSFEEGNEKLFRGSVFNGTE
jgi:hypothetical protein